MVALDINLNQLLVRGGKSNVLQNILYATEAYNEYVY
jgi:hypothetical protein